MLTTRRAILISGAGALGACATGMPVEETKSANDYLDLFRAENPARTDEALADITGNPGAFAPFFFPAVAYTLFRRERLEDAYQWHMFGRIRAHTQLAYDAPDQPSGGPAGAMLSTYYDQRGGEAFATAADAMPLARRRDLFVQIGAVEEQAPRLYPPNWLNLPDFGANTNWARAPARWPDDSGVRWITARNLVMTDARNAFARDLAAQPG